jgi:CRP/FNR family transcriptional regulator, cyclic AMP receptor protein
VSGLASLLPSEAWRALVQQGRPRAYARGEVLLRQGEEGTYVLLLVSGNVKIVRSERDGREMVLALRGPGEALGEISAWDGSRRSATVISVSNCLVHIVSAEHFRRTVHRFGAEETVLRHALTRLREGEDVRADLADLPAGERLVRLLLRLATALAPTDAGAPPVDLGLSQEDLAGAAGLSRSAVAAELSRLRGRGLVRTGRRKVLLCDLPGLQTLADQDRRSWNDRMMC